VAARVRGAAACAGCPGFHLHAVGRRAASRRAADAGDDFHCPLCIAAADFVVPAVAAAHAPPTLHAIAIVDSRVASPDRLFSPRPPPSRAPPAIS
jgi:hypothetical protein